MIVSVVFLILIVPHYAKSVVYGPSLVSLTKYNREVNGPTIFHPETGRLIHLADYPNYSVVIPLAPDSPTATSNQVFVSRRISGPGEFVVEAPEGHGVMATIQSMDFRTAPSGCNDFIQFGEIDGGVETTGTCGKVDNRDENFTPSRLVGPRVFLSPSGKIRTLFYHGYIWGLVRNFNFDILDPSRNPVLRLEIVFTAYKECNEPKPSLSGIVSSQEYRSCSNTPDRRTCIRSQLFCDRILNCGFEDSFASDEFVSNCVPSLFNLLLPHVLPIIKYSSTSTQPTTSRTTTTPTTTTPVTTTTPKPSTTKSTDLFQKGKTFSKLLHEQIIDISPAPTVYTTNAQFSTSSTSSKIYTVTSEHTTEKYTTSAPAIIETTQKSQIEEESTGIRNASSDTNFKQMQALEKILKINMTFNDESHLFADQDDEQIEELGNNNSTNNDIENEHDDGNLRSFFIWFTVTAVCLLSIFMFLRLFCCNHRVIWVPNPKRLRRKVRNDVNTEEEQDQGSSGFSNQFPDVHQLGTSKRKETPPSYDILFPDPKFSDKHLNV